MSKEETAVAHLHKVLLRIDVPARTGGSGPEGAPVPYDFVFGIGSEGLSPLEMALEGKRPGEEVQVEVPPEGPGALFGHLAPPPALVQPHPGPERLRVAVEQVERAEEREVVRAMSEAAACGSDCCGHH